MPTTTTTTTTHSAGPWEIDPVDVFLIRDANDDLLATVELEDRSDAEFDANARLIAAAPELLAALKRLVACPDVNLDMLSPETIVAADQARAALAKAEGRDA